MKTYTLRGGPSTKLERRLFKAWQPSNHSKNSSISSKPDHAHICTINIVLFVKDFKVTASIPRGCNSSFITLVPKADDPLVIEDFCPISLIGRQIIDGPLMVDEIIAWAKKYLMVDEIIAWSKEYKKRIMFLKVNFEKAFDSLTLALVLVNGSPTKEFKTERGIRQGDPLSLFLFILAVEALNVALLEATNNNIFHGIKVGKDKIHISHLRFANDALITGEWSRSNAKNLSRILTCFHLASGLKVNFNKSKLYGISTSNIELCYLASTIGCLAS
ncbi:putative RNA-directed DNA polymerase, eukaryota, reverse transcriptase zinc-binding domain protein [Tanacetum coccineum]